MAPNKSLAAQLANEFREFFPENAVEYFVSYYDYYQPEAYVPQTDTYIEKDSSINDEIERLRHSATAALLTRRDVLIVASVSASTAWGRPRSTLGQILRVHKGVATDRDCAMRRLVDIQYDRNQRELHAGQVPRPGDMIEVFPAYEETGVRIEWWGDDDRADQPVRPDHRRDPRRAPRDHDLPGHALRHPRGAHEAAIVGSRRSWGAPGLARGQGKLLEAQRLRMRTTYDLEMLREVGVLLGDRELPATSTAASRASRRTRCSTTSPTTGCA